MRRLILSIVISQFTNLFSQNLDIPSQKALEQTKELLTSLEKRGQYIKENAKGKEANDIVNKLGGTPEQTQRLYEIAASIFDKMIKEYNGDAIEVQRLLQQSPENFANTLGPDHMNKIKQLASELGKTPNPAP